MINVLLSLHGRMEEGSWILGNTFLFSLSFFLNMCGYFFIFHHPSRTEFIMFVTSLSELI